MTGPSNPPEESLPDQPMELTPDEVGFLELYRQSLSSRSGAVGLALARMIMTDGETAGLFEAWQAVPSEHRGLILHLLRKMGEACEDEGD